MNVMGVAKTESVVETSANEVPTFQLWFSNKEYTVAVDEREARFELKIAASGIDWRYFMLKDVRVMVNRKQIQPAITMYYNGGSPIETGTDEWLSITERFDMQSLDAQNLDRELKELIEHFDQLTRERRDKKEEKDEQIIRQKRKIAELQARGKEFTSVTETKEVIVKTGVFAALAINDLKPEVRPVLDQKTLDLYYPPAKAGTYEINAEVECIVCRIAGPRPTRYSGNKIVLKVEAEDDDNREK